MKKVLIIEDEQSIAELERDYLEIEGFETDIELNGRTGLQRALQGNYAMIILDVMLPEVDGFEICRTIRNNSDVPIIIVSAKKEDIDKIRGLGLGADDYMTKPFSPAELVARIKSHLARYNRLVNQRVDDHNEELKIKGLVINKNSRRVYLNGQEIQLTNKEFDLLVFLAENPERVLSKEQIFEKIWGMNTWGEITTVAVHIRKIREKMEEDTSNPQYIETVWGVGYRFKVS
ncbi:DNA-binding response regulator, OmpR family, contains REC and winged-helix (wHTH) domain [Desulfotomaculum arcticum]|uniref:Stage 0 sporulation protein A homolog n=1 Tax=Desulfotruncus arcticus DSM 17038 TaxID=1121424 RepID=A0A1I2XPP1_9FIRM|nr:response regulator transcription factor [Desulfotruncus arcticus]SFH15345.1 DNA-binding response regulator, OmpR family, contains REC and winged-helix (wHTH) domain [Desulfotomaculum arcticum] [Desulfotruncus arcticus DSM 17038]